MTKLLTYVDRLEIEVYLKDNCSFGEIGMKLGKDRTTIAKEIKKRSYERKSGYCGWPYNACRNRTSCKASKLCGQDCPRKSIQYCKFCNQCNDFCPEFVEKVCIARFKSPPMYVMAVVSITSAPLRRPLMTLRTPISPSRKISPNQEAESCLTRRSLHG